MGRWRLLLLESGQQSSDRLAHRPELPNILVFLIGNTKPQLLQLGALLVQEFLESFN